MKKKLFAILVCFLVVSCGLAEDSFVVDKAGLLSEEQKQHMSKYHEALLRDLDVHFKLIISADELPDIDTSAEQKFGDLGTKTSAARGLLFLVDPVDQRVRIEVGYDLEGVFPDGFVGYLEESQMKPFFEQNMVGQGVEATGELLVSRMLRAKDGHHFDSTLELGDLDYFSGGAGAKVKYSQKSVLDKKRYQGSGEDFGPQESPLFAFEKYKDVLQQRIKDPDLTLYTSSTREFFGKWVVTDGQQANELQSLQSNSYEKILIDEGRAVIRFSAKKRTLPPYLFQKGEDGWMIDFATMTQIIQMNHKNQWRLRSTDHPYMFGFEGWRFDKNGFPFE